MAQASSGVQRSVKIETIDDFRRMLDHAARTSSPQIAALARWLSSCPDEVAFRSVRQLAMAADANPNTVVRLSAALGYEGYGALQTAIRELLRPETGYAQRAAALNARGSGKGWPASEMTAAAQVNLQALDTPAALSQIEDSVTALLAARHVHCIGVRSCYSVAHYLSYAGAMALPNFQPTPSQPGLLADALSACTPEDVVIAISYAHYSCEVVRGVQIARDCGARIIALTDNFASPIAQGAWQVFRLTTEGPQLLPSLLPAFHFCEILLAELAARTPDTESRIRAFEKRMLHVGGYVRAQDSRDA